jgi:hypothetical protein
MNQKSNICDQSTISRLVSKSILIIMSKINPATTTTTTTSYVCSCFHIHATIFCTVAVLVVVPTTPAEAAHHSIFFLSLCLSIFCFRVGPDVSHDSDSISLIYFKIFKKGKIGLQQCTHDGGRTTLEE